MKSSKVGVYGMCACTAEEGGGRADPGHVLTDKCTSMCCSFQARCNQKWPRKCGLHECCSLQAQCVPYAPGTALLK